MIALTFSEDRTDFALIVDGSKTSAGSLLHLACAKNDPDAARALLAAGANPCVQNDDGKTALQVGFERF